ncbi:CocE/NonD family hydrolase [Aeoliella sp. ICT_H6.2]|uniref:CocE/NonD family hydrolase n=1 Tax=Aeoliella straminimaris TaxID=2954799 RepID=A0A9X2JIL1_9BACT|nr:CocE/NonD family hydrolase [Aeoliella straminimaris]MCO6044039.1 CocE/NonD family hydrolase [Aeoliella straminimaris]
MRIKQVLQTCTLTLSLLILLPTVATVAAGDDSGDRISAPGRYIGYSQPIYADDFAISSQYVTMRDGTKLAIDICRPKDKTTGEVVETPLPVLWMHTPYNRRYNGNSKENLTVDHYAGTASRLIKYGYVVATVDFRGLFASFGHNEGYNRGEWLSAARYDAYDITEWLAQQSWSNGNIGMWGCSATGGSQMQAATTAPPHLKAIFPMSFEFDVYDFRVPGGISNVRDPRATPPGQPLPQERRDAMAAPVDSDTDGSLLKAALTDHAGTVESGGQIPFRDSYSKFFTDDAVGQWWIKSSPSTYLDEINASGIAMYMAVNWDEGATKPGPFFAINNFTLPTKLIISPGGHCDCLTPKELTGFDIVIEELRFFDYWLKGIDNGIMDEDPVYFFTYNAPEGSEWRSADAWPLPEEKRVEFYLGEGLLSTKEPEQPGKDETEVTYDFRPGTEKPSGALIYETAPLDEDIQITGHPEIKLWVSSTADDGDFVATIQDVAPDGTVTSYNVQGQLRASMRKLAEPPYDNLGLPYHRFIESDVTPLVPGEPTELSFSIQPISMIIKAGHKIQLAISFAGRGTRRIEPAPEVTVYRDPAHPSRVILPIVPIQTSPVDGAPSANRAC